MPSLRNRVRSIFWSARRRAHERLIESAPYLSAYAQNTDIEIGKQSGDAYLAQPQGLFQFQYLIENGLLPAHRLLDIGCGALRGGRHFISYLSTGNYTGIELSPKAFDAARSVVANDGGLTAKAPRLVLNSEKNLRFETFRGETFDVLLAQSVFTHLPADQLEECFAHVGTIMRPRSRFFFTFREGRQQRSGFSFRYPSAFILAATSRFGLAAEIRPDYPHVSGQKMVVATLAGRGLKA